MNKVLWNDFNASRYFSNHRLTTFNNSEELYKFNIELSSAFYSSLSVFEIVLRNEVQNSLSNYFKRDDWWEALRDEPGFAFLLRQIDDIHKKVKNKQHPVPSTVAELSFGFWTSLFNGQYKKLLWKPLRLIFSNLDKKLRQQKLIRTYLNDIRIFRNRVYHYEPILFKYPDKINFDIHTLLTWIDKDAEAWLRSIDRVETILTSGHNKIEKRAKDE